MSGRQRAVAGLVLALALAPAARAHTTELRLSLRLAGSVLEMVADSAEGYRVTAGRFEYRLEGPGGRTPVLGLEEAGRNTGVYRGPAPSLPAGDYTLLVRDRTYQNEAAEARAPVRWPPAAPVRLVMPPGGRSGAGPSPALVALVAPVVLALAVLAYSLLQQRARSRAG